MTDKRTQANTREAEIEAHLVKRIKALGGEAYKFTSPARRSVPDRLVLLPQYASEDAHGSQVDPYRVDGAAIFVELKSPGRKPTDAQAREHTKLRALGFRVEVLDSIAAVDAFVGSVTHGKTTGRRYFNYPETQP